MSKKESRELSKRGENFLTRSFQNHKIGPYIPEIILILSLLMCASLLNRSWDRFLTRTSDDYYGYLDFDLPSTLLFSSMGLLTAINGSMINSGDEFSKVIQSQFSNYIKFLSIMAVIGFFMLFPPFAFYLWMIILVLQPILSVYIIYNTFKLPSNNQYHKFIKVLLILIALAITYLQRLIADELGNILSNRYVEEFSWLPLPFLLFIFNLAIFNYSPKLHKLDDVNLYPANENNQE